MGKKKGDADAPLGMTPEQAAEAADAQVTPRCIHAVVAGLRRQPRLFTVPASQDLLRHAVRSGVLSETRRLPAKGVALPPGDHVVAQSHRDIMKKPAQRKHRYLVLLCAQIAPVAAGKIGSLAKLDTRNPGADAGLCMRHAMGVGPNVTSHGSLPLTPLRTSSHVPGLRGRPLEAPGDARLPQSAVPRAEARAERARAV